MSLQAALENRERLGSLLQDDSELDGLAQAVFTPNGKTQVHVSRKELVTKVVNLLSASGLDAEVRVLDSDMADPLVLQAYDRDELSEPISSWYREIRKRNPNVIGISYNSLRVRIEVQDLQRYYDEPHLRKGISNTLILKLSSGQQVALPVVIAERK